MYLNVHTLCRHMQRKVTIVWYRGLYMEIHKDISIILAIETVKGIDLDIKMCS